jgi:hypothetical protein
MDTETKPLWTTTREAMGKTWTVGLFPNDVALTVDRGGSPLLGGVEMRDQLVAIKAAANFDTRDEILLHELIELCLTETDCSVKHPIINRLSFTLFAFLRGFGLWQDFPWPDKEM